MQRRVVRVDIAFHQSALVQQETAELAHGITAVFGPKGAVPFRQDVIHAFLQVVIQIQ